MTDQPRTSDGKYTFKAAGAPVGTLDDPWGGGGRRDEQIALATWQPTPLPDPQDAAETAQGAESDLWEARHHLYAAAVLDALEGVEAVGVDEYDHLTDMTTPTPARLTLAQRIAAAHALERVLAEEGTSGYLDSQPEEYLTRESDLYQWLRQQGAVGRADLTPVSVGQVRDLSARARAAWTAALAARLHTALDEAADDAYVVVEPSRHGVTVLADERIEGLGSASDSLSRGVVSVDEPARGLDVADAEQLTALLPGGRTDRFGRWTVTAGAWRAATGRDQVPGQVLAVF